MSYNSRVQPHPKQRSLLLSSLLISLVKRKPYFISNDYVPGEAEDWPYYECIWCNIIDEMDPGNEDKGGDDAGIVISTNIDEVFLCSRCRVIFSY